MKRLMTTMETVCTNLFLGFVRQRLLAEYPDADEVVHFGASANTGTHSSPDSSVGHLDAQIRDLKNRRAISCGSIQAESTLWVS